MLFPSAIKLSISSIFSKNNSSESSVPVNFFVLKFNILEKLYIFSKDILKEERNACKYHDWFKKIFQTNFFIKKRPAFKQVLFVC